MASNLPLTFTTIQFQRTPHTLPFFSLRPLNFTSGLWSPNSNRSSRGLYVQALQEQVLEPASSSDSPQPTVEIEIASTDSDSAKLSSSTGATSSKFVLVAGGSGGVGQLVVASLLSRNIKSRLLLRDPSKATTLFGEHDEEKLQVCKGDTRNPDDVHPDIFEGVTHVICCTGTTAFPSKRWEGDNTPERVDWDGVRNLIAALPPTVKRVVLVSSIGVTKFNELPWSLMNLFGVLKYKKMGEDFLRNSGLPFTIIRPGRLTDGPYTSYDLNTLLKATAGERRAVLIGQGDKLVGEASRLVVAEACIQALDIECTEGQIYEISSVEGNGPGEDRDKWEQLFRSAEGR